jgi:sulfite exporter TauE/SafE
MDMANIDSPLAALVAGLITSLHCTGMCGPMACWLSPTKPEEDATTIYSVYHVTRLAGYAVLGGVAGLVGQGPLALLGDSALRYAPWALVVFFVAVAMRWDRHLPRSGWLMHLKLKVQAKLHGRSRVTTAAVLGATTPLLPCGPLYLVVAVAALSGSALRGVEFMLAFGLGTLPLLWVVQANFGWLRTKLTPVWMARLQITLAVAAAVMITWRLRGTLGWTGPLSDPASCCH